MNEVGRRHGASDRAEPSALTGPPRPWIAALVALVGVAWWVVFGAFWLLVTCPDGIEENGGGSTKPGTAYGQAFCHDGPQRTLLADGAAIALQVLIPLAIIAWATRATYRRGPWQAFAMPVAITVVFVVAGKLAMVGAIPR